MVDGFPETLGGGERIVLRLAALLPRYGYRASILTFAMSPHGEFQAADAPCPLYLLPLQKTYDRSALRGAVAFRRFLADQQVQIVQTFFESSDIWAGFFARACSSARLIWSRRDMGILRGRKHTLAYRALRHLPHAVFAVSEQVRRHAIEVDGIRAGKVHTIYNGLDLSPSSRHAGRLPGTPLVIATTGNIRRVKGHDLLIRAARDVVDHFPEAQFTIAGEVLEPAYFEELQALLQDLGLTNHFRFLGRITDVRSYLADATLFVLPSRSEGFSNALIEAMAAGVPAVATDVGGNAEAIEDGASGLIVPPESVAALTEAILHLLRSPEAAEAMGRAGQEVVARRFTTEAMMGNVTSVYTKLLSLQ